MLRCADTTSSWMLLGCIFIFRNFVDGRITVTWDTRSSNTPVQVPVNSRISCIAPTARTEKSEMERGLKEAVSLIVTRGVAWRGGQTYCTSKAVQIFSVLLHFPGYFTRNRRLFYV
jgi:hypothetical protein